MLILNPFDISESIHVAFAAAVTAMIFFAVPIERENADKLQIY